MQVSKEDQEDSLPPEDEELREAIHTSLERLRHVAWFLHCRTKLSVQCTKHRDMGPGSIHTLKTAPASLEAIEQEVASWACRLLLSDR